MKKRTFGSISLSLMLAILACSIPFQQNEPIEYIEEDKDQSELSESTAPLQAVDPAPSVDAVTPSGNIEPNDLVYLGAFRLPDDNGGSSWDYSGQALTYYPEGDPDGDEDGFPGSLFGVGHDQQLYVSEITIPVPVISENLDDLNTAITIQTFQDFSDGIVVAEDMQLPVVGLEYLPPQNGQSTGKLHFTWGQHFQYFDLSHGWSNLDLANPQSDGPWYFNGYTNYTTSDYLFEIPEEWANTYTPGLRLATGRFREGIWSGCGPAIFAYGPWTEGSPPTANTTLTNIKPLLLYGYQEPEIPEIISDEANHMNGYQEADHWFGAAWLTYGDRSAVIFSGTKGVGSSWYGFANGVIWDYECGEQDPPTCPDVPEWPYNDRGYWAEDYQGQLIFFDPDDLAAVALGQMETFEPQPYATLDLTPYLFAPQLDFGEYKRDIIAASAFDREHGILYVIERLADEYKSVIHVFELQ
jgi:hypothetical protein